MAAALRGLIQNQYPIFTDIGNADILHAYAHDLAFAPFAPWADCKEITWAYLEIEFHAHQWKHIADIHAALWSSETLLQLLYGLSRCSKKVRPEIVRALDKHRTSFEQVGFLLALIPTCLHTIIEIVHQKAFKRAAHAFFIIHKLTLLIPHGARATIMHHFLTEQLMFHFHFDYVIPLQADVATANIFRCNVLNSFPCKFDIYVETVSAFVAFPPEFIHKYLCMFAIPMAILIGINNPGCQDALHECLEFALYSDPDVSFKAKAREGGGVEGMGFVLNFFLMVTVFPSSFSSNGTL